MLRRRGLSLSSFKCGPDYIDPKFHALASGGESINLDLYMSSPRHVEDVYERHTENAEAVVVEGVMGLFDGYEKMQGSSADLARLLRLPIILLVNAASSAYSIGALIYGLAHWQPDVEIAGVVFNKVASENHFLFLKDAAEDAGVPVLGYLPRSSTLNVPSRHLGLSLEELSRLESFPDEVADLIESYVDVDRLLELCQREKRRGKPSLPSHPQKGMRIGVAKDEAFNFIYQENIRQLERLGEVIYFSPLRDDKLPEGLSLVYLPGGYPEFYLHELSSNQGMRASIKAFVQNDGYLYGECGGMMYLMDAILDEAGETYPMCGVFDAQATMQDMRLTLGYRNLKTQTGQDFKGHESDTSSFRMLRNSLFDQSIGEVG